MKILSIGDIHGKDAWKFITHNSSYEYNLWRTAIDNGVSPYSQQFKHLNYFNYDKIIFIGDYVDAFKVTNVVILHNLNEIIHLKRTLGDKVVLILGNHDIQYFIHGQICTGYRAEMYFDLNTIFKTNLDLFKLAHEEVGKDGSKYLWTHAGVTSGWYDVLIKNMLNPKFRFHEIVKENDIFNKTVAEVLNLAWSLNLDVIYHIDPISGGYDLWAGPLWVRPDRFNNYPLVGYNQIVGHTHQATIKIVNEDTSGNKFEGDFKHYFIDCLDYEYTPLILEI